MRTAFITGVTGQDGAYLSELLLKENYNVIGLVRSNNTKNFEKLEFLKIKEKITFEECDLLDIPAIVKLIIKYGPQEIYNLAAQSSVGKSFEQPIGTINYNIISVLNLLESIKITNNKIRFYQASSSEMFGKVENLPITESTPMHPLSPYAISKASAHWITINYRESFNLFACCGILFNHESYLRSPNFFVKKVIKEAIEIKNGKRKNFDVGNLDLKRDFGFAPDYVKAMWLMMQQESPSDYLICSGKSLSLKTILHYICEKLSIDKSLITQKQSLFRPVDIEDIYGDNTKAKNCLGWNYSRSFYEVIDILIEQEMKCGDV